MVLNENGELKIISYVVVEVFKKRYFDVFWVIKNMKCL